MELNAENTKYKGSALPWVNDYGVVYSDQGIQGHVCDMTDFFDKETTAFNARLISQAPKMYLELQQLYLSIIGGGDVVSFQKHDIERIESMLRAVVETD